MSTRNNTSHRPYSRGRRIPFYRRYFKSTIIALVVLTIGIGSFSWRGFSSDSSEVTPANVRIPQRVISLAPSITELIYALGADSALSAVTHYCKYPPQADTLPDIGGFFDPNLELIVSLNPDLVVLLKEHDDLHIKLNKLHIPILTVDHQTVDGILDSYTTLGYRLGANKKADSLQASHRQRISRIEKLTASLGHPRTLVSIGHSDKPEVIASVYAAGNEGFYSELVRMAGGNNIVDVENIRYPVLGPEAIGALAPEIILDVFPGEETGDTVDVHFVQEQWRSLSDVPAVSKNRVVVMSGGFFVIPGPRFVDILEKFVAALHPEISQSLLKP